MNKPSNAVLTLLSLPFIAAAQAQTPAQTPSPNDLFFRQQWGLHNDGTQTVQVDIDDLHGVQQLGTPGADIGWLEAQGSLSGRTTAPVIVAVIDTGIDPKHPDLAGRIADGGYDFLTQSKDLSDKMGHGTHISGIIAANSGNAIGISGITPSSVKILPLRVLSPDFQNFAYNHKSIADYSAEAVRYAVSHGASIINMSLGWPEIADTENARKAVAEATQAGVLVVVAAGNDHKDAAAYPCSYEGVLCIGAITNTGELSYFSNMGGLVDLLAPGEGIISLYPTDLDSPNLRIQGYENLSGTSQAAPFVVGIAATLKSLNPAISLNELKARLLASAGPAHAPSANSLPDSLYGLVNFKRAVDAVPSPVYFPDFKPLDTVTVDESSFIAQSRVSVQNLWAPAQGVHAQVYVNDKLAGEANSASLAAGESLVIDWKYKFDSLEESSDLRIRLQITDGSGSRKDFSLRLSAVRALEAISARHAYPVPPTTASEPTDFIGSNNGRNFSKLTTVPTYPVTSGAPAYVRKLTATALGSVLEFYDPSGPIPVKTVRIPYVQQIDNVMRIDLNGDGHLEWLVQGLGSNQGQLFLQFYFLTPTFEPLYWGDDSGWQIPLDSKLGALIHYSDPANKVVRVFSKPGSWIQAAGKLVPCFFDSGPLPDQDNFDLLNTRHYGNDRHLYYFMPKKLTTPYTGGPIPFEVRALDNAAFRSKNTRLRLQSPIPQTAADQKAGHLRILLTTDYGLEAPTAIWDIRSLTDTSTTVVDGWDTLTSSGQPSKVLPDQSTAYTNFYDPTRGSVAWSGADGKFQSRSEFTYAQVGNPITGFLGAFHIPSIGHVWFLESAFTLVAFHQSEGDASAEPQITQIPIERDSSFRGKQFSELFTPITVGTPGHPLPGMYIDSSLVRGNRVSVAVWNPQTSRLEKPLRYSLRVPANCVQMEPMKSDSADESFGLPLFCNHGGQADFRVVLPGQATQ